MPEPDRHLDHVDEPIAVAATALAFWNALRRGQPPGSVGISTAPAPGLRELLKEITWVLDHPVAREDMLRWIEDLQRIHWAVSRARPAFNTGNILDAITLDSRVIYRWPWVVCADQHCSPFHVRACPYIREDPIAYRNREVLLNHWLPMQEARRA